LIYNIVTFIEGVEPVYTPDGLPTHNFLKCALEFALQYKPRYIDCVNELVDLEGFTFWLSEQNASELSTRGVILLKLVLVIKR